MLGLLGALAFGVVAYGAWASADQTERNGRINSQQSKCNFYIDKNGNMRHTKNGKKYTSEEIHQIFNPQTLQEKLTDYDKKVEDLHKEIFYCVDVHTTNHFFLTKDDAIKFINEYNSKITAYPEYLCVKLSKFMYNKLQVETYVKIGAVCHFDYDKYIGELDKPWKKK